MILVVGATGAVGETLVRTLRKLKVDTRALVRSGSEYFWLNDTGTQFFFGDLRDKTSIERSTIGIEYAILSADIAMETRDNNYQHIQNGYEHLVQSLKKRGCKKIILISCLGTESDLPIPSFYTRRSLEKLVINSSIPYTILRTPPHETFFLRLAINNTVLPKCSGNILYPITTYDISLMAAASIDLRSTVNKVISIGGKQELSARGAYEMACNLVQQDPKPNYLSPFLYKGIQKLKRPMRRYANLWAEYDHWFQVDFPMDPSALERQFGIQLSNFEDAMKEKSETLLIRNDADLREQHMVHPQFYATVYQPGTAKVSEMPTGPIRQSVD